MSFNLNEEVIDGHLVTADVKKLWAVEMDLAQKLLEVCKKHNLKIWASGGTLLGAVRHKGFIPWDDDIDFVMMRDDYNKLLEVGPKEFKEPYFFQSFYTDKHFWGGMAKIRRSDTAMIEKDYKSHKDFNRGIFIDVFVLDALPDDFNELEKIYKKVKFLRKLLTNYRVVDAKYFNMKGKIRHFLITTLFTIINQDKAQERIVKLLSSHSIKDYEMCGQIDFCVQEDIDVTKIIGGNKHCYDETIMLPFHDFLIPVPKGYDEMLRRQYGEYMMPKKCNPMHANIVVDCERSYREVLKELKK